MDEVFETVTLMQTGKIKDFPIVVMGSDYWKHMRQFLSDTMLKNETIDENDLSFARLTDTPQDALDLIRLHTAGKSL